MSLEDLTADRKSLKTLSGIQIGCRGEFIRPGRLKSPLRLAMSKRDL